MKRVDLEALRRAIAMARNSDPLQAQQIASMLEERQWLEVALFAAYCCQTQALNLRSWQPPPCDMGDDKPIDDFPLAGKQAAWELRRLLLAAGLSMCTSPTRSTRSTPALRRRRRLKRRAPRHARNGAPRIFSHLPVRRKT